MLAIFCRRYLQKRKARLLEAALLKEGIDASLSADAAKLTVISLNGNDDDLLNNPPSLSSSSSEKQDVTMLVSQ